MSGKWKIRGAAACCVAAIMAAVPSASAEVISYWNFNQNDGDLLNWDPSYGPGALALEAGWTNLATVTGTDQNALFGDPAGDALELRGNSNNGRSADFHVSAAGYSDIVLSFDIQRNSPGFNGNQILYSLNGVDFSLFSPFGPPTAFATMTFDLSSVAELNDAADIYLRIRFNGAANNGGRNTLDNVIIEGNAIPAPPAAILLALAGLARRRRR